MITPPRVRPLKTFRLAFAAALLAQSCTLLTRDQRAEPCDEDRACAEAFGLGATCAEDGFCVEIEQAKFVDGVSALEIRTVGIADLSGSLKDLGQGMRDGVLAAYAAHQRAHPTARRFTHEVRDDVYDPERSVRIVKEVTRDIGAGGRYAFAIVGSMGSPTSDAMLPVINDRDVPLFGTYSGATHLRRVPPDAMVWNTRASYSKEAETITRYLLDRDPDGVPPQNLFAFSQSPLDIDTPGYADRSREAASLEPGQASLDPYGMSGYIGIVAALEGRLGSRTDIPLGTYQARSTNTRIAQEFFFRWLGGLAERLPGPDLEGSSPEIGIAMVPVASAATDFVRGVIDGMNDLKLGQRPAALSESDWEAIGLERRRAMSAVNLTFASISPAGDQLALNLAAAGASTYCTMQYPLIVSQVVPLPDGGSLGAKQFRDDLNALNPNLTPGYVNFEGWVAGRVFIEAVERVEGELTVGKLIDVLQSSDFKVDLGIGAPIRFSANNHDGSDIVYGSRLNTRCAYDNFDALRRISQEL